MHPKSKGILLGIIAVVAASGFIAWSIHSRSIPEFNVSPVPKNSPTLNQADVEKILGVEKFRVFRRVRQVPIAVKESFSNFTGFPFDLVDPWQAIGTDDMSLGKSSRRLVFLGLSDDSAVLVYEQGGFANAFITLVFWFGDTGQGWGATLEYGSIPEDLSDLRKVIRTGKFRAWQPQV